MTNKPTKMAVFNIFVFYILFTLSSIACATSPLPNNLIALPSKTGNELLLRSIDRKYFWPLMLNFESQKNLFYCSIASSVIVLNALQIPAPSDPIFKPFQIFTQTNFFTPAVSKILPEALVNKQGATLDEITAALNTFADNAKAYHANKITLQQFRELAKNIIKNNQGYIIVNFFRPGIKEQGGGHMSPLAAYDQKSDRFLLLDVARYRYVPVWVSAADLWKSMDTYDKGAKAYRGFVVVYKRTVIPANAGI